MKHDDLYAVSLPVPKALYPAETVLKTAYQFLDRCYIHAGETDSDWIINIQPKQKSDDADTLTAAFENELIVQSVRRHVSQQTAHLRELLLARAMASSMILEEDPVTYVEAQDSDVSDEALQEILTNWFDQHE